MAALKAAGGHHPDQFARLDEFRAGHPGAVIGEGDFGGWDASLPLTDGGERFLHRHELEELLDDAEEIAAGGDPRANPG
jgi:hypothetical protein